MLQLFTGWAEQVQWSACFEGKSKKNRSGHLDYKVLNQGRLNASFPLLVFPRVSNLKSP